jgi:hypothetical protein
MYSIEMCVDRVRDFHVCYFQNTLALASSLYFLTDP